MRSASNVSAAVAGFAMPFASYTGVDASARTSPVAGIEHHDRAAILAQRPDRGPLQPQVERRPEAQRLVGRRVELAEQPAERVRPRQPEELRVVRALEPRRAELARRIPEDVAERVVAVLAQRLAVVVARAAGEPAVVAVDDRSAERAPGDGDDGRIVGRPSTAAAPRRPASTRRRPRGPRTPRSAPCPVRRTLPAIERRDAPGPLMRRASGDPAGAGARRAAQRAAPVRGPRARAGARRPPRSRAATTRRTR